MDRQHRSDLALIYAMLQVSGIRSIDLADLASYEVVEITDDNCELFDCFPWHGPGMKVRFGRAWIADVAGLPAARTYIEAAARTPVTLIRDPYPHIPDRWIPVPFDHPDLTRATAIVAAAEE